MSGLVTGMPEWEEHRFHQWLRQMDQAARWAPLTPRPGGVNQVAMERGHQVAVIDRGRCLPWANRTHLASKVSVRFSIVIAHS